MAISTFELEDLEIKMYTVFFFFFFLFLGWGGGGRDWFVIVLFDLSNNDSMDENNQKHRELWMESFKKEALMRSNYDFYESEMMDCFLPKPNVGRNGDFGLKLAEDEK